MNIFFLEPDGSTCYTKGHVDKQEFIEAMAIESGMSTEELDIELEDIKHTLARCVPVPGGKHGHQAYGFDFFVYFNQERKRGAFPVTYVML